MINEQYKYSDISEKIIGCAMKVHRTLGNGFQEVIYQRALAIELKKQKLDFQREMEMPVMYEGQQIPINEISKSSSICGSDNMIPKMQRQRHGKDGQYGFCFRIFVFLK